MSKLVASYMVLAASGQKLDPENPPELVPAQLPWQALDQPWDGISDWKADSNKVSACTSGCNVNLLCLLYIDVDRALHIPVSNYGYMFCAKASAFVQYIVELCTRTVCSLKSFVPAVNTYSYKYTLKALVGSYTGNWVFSGSCVSLAIFLLLKQLFMFHEQLGKLPAYRLFPTPLTGYSLARLFWFSFIGLSLGGDGGGNVQYGNSSILFRWRSQLKALLHLRQGVASDWSAATIFSLATCRRR